MPEKKSPSLSEKNRKLQLKLRTSEKRFSQLKGMFERLCEQMGYQKLGTSWAEEHQYGWINSWLFPIYAFINSQIDQKITANFRNQVVDIARSIILQLIVLGKYGITLPPETRPSEWQRETEKTELCENYPPCIICGENRITEICHIVPRSQGGMSHPDNYLRLCPTHHHLLDHCRLSKSEWAFLEKAIEEKTETAKIYANRVYLERLKSQLSWRDDLPDNFKK